MPAWNDFVERCIADWKDDDLSTGTIKTLFSILADFVKFHWQVILDTKRLKFKFFGDRVVPQNKIKVWNALQVKTALHRAALKDPELQDLMVVALETGMRRGEIFALTYEDIDLINSQITISKSLDLETMEVGPTKTKQTRTVQMSTRVAKIFEKGYTPGKETERCFKAYNPNQRLKALSRGGDLPTLSFHDLRHTFATTCLEKGLSPKWVSATLGHAKLSTTFDVYWQCFREKQNMENLYE
jgi:integrase